MEGQRICLAMYAGKTYQESADKLTAAGLPVINHPEVLGNFKALQRALNTYSDKKKLGLTKLWVDGRIGPLTAANTVIVLGDMGTIAPPETVDQTALMSWCMNLPAKIATAAGTTADTTNKRKTGENPEASPTADIPEGGASGLLPTPGDEPKQAGLVWWVVGGMALIGVVAAGVSLYRGREEEEGGLFPETI